MPKFIDIENDIFGVLGSPEWLAENIIVCPSNFMPDTWPTEYIELSVICGKGANLRSSKGIMLAEIHTQLGNGPSRSSQIADTLDKHLFGKTFTTSSGSMQFMDSSLDAGRNDFEAGYNKRTYNINFNYYGV